MLESLVAFYKDESGDILQTGIIMAILAVIAVGALVYLTPRIRNNFNSAGNQLDTSSQHSY